MSNELNEEPLFTQEPLIQPEPKHRLAEAVSEKLAELAEERRVEQAYADFDSPSFAKRVAARIQLET